jgi:uncharacterized protein YjbI with pentapeptide repeats
MLLAYDAIHAMRASRPLMQAAKQSYYTVLGVGENASQEAIKQHYLQMAKRLHPDVSTGDTKKFQELQRAYETLKDSNLRSKYDFALKYEEAQSAEKAAKAAYEQAKKAAYESAQKTAKAAYEKTKKAAYEGAKKTAYQGAEKTARSPLLKALALGGVASAAVIAGQTLYERNYKTFSRFDAMSAEEKLKSSEHNARVVQGTRKCRECYLANADLQVKKLSGVDFSGAYLVGTQFAKADLTGAKFEKSDLLFTDFDQADLRNANFKDVKVWGNVYFTDADLTNANLTGLGIWYYPNQGIKPDANGRLPYVIDFTRAKLKGANFTNAPGLTNADFSGADLTGADLTGANITGATFTGAILKGTKLDTSKLDPITWVSYQYQNAW